MNTRARAITTSILAGMIFLLFRYAVSNFLDAENYRLLVVASYLVFAVVVTSLVCWVLFFKLTPKYILLTAAFPAISLMPLWFLVDTFITVIESVLGPNLSVFVLAISLTLIMYLLILTVNILNGARLKNIPLAQAAKASQFLTVLLSTYFALTLVLSSGINLALAGVIVSLFMGYQVYSAITMQRLQPKQELATVSLIILTLIIAYYMLVLWPLPVAYTTALITIVFYMLLNRALEVRTGRVRYLWLEYLLLFFLMAVILLTNGSWGISGSII